MAVDHLGTPRLVTDACAVTRAQHTYYPFGFEATSSERRLCRRERGGAGGHERRVGGRSGAEPPATHGHQDAEAMKFTGHERDLQGTYGSQTDDLDYMHARHYSPGLARFLVPDALRGDPRRPQTFNLFAYVTGNPSTYTDPWGMDGDRFAGEIVVVAQLPDQDGSDLAFGLAYLRFLLYGPTTPPVGIDGGGGVGGNTESAGGSESAQCVPVPGALIEEARTNELLAAMLFGPNGVPTGAEGLSLGPLDVAFFGIAGWLRGVAGSVAFDWSPSVVGHIFRRAPGHVSPLTGASRQRFAGLFERVAGDSRNAVSLGEAQTRAGLLGFERQFARGTVWVEVRNGLIHNAGVNRCGGL